MRRLINENSPQYETKCIKIVKKHNLSSFITQNYLTVSLVLTKLNKTGLKVKKVVIEW